MRQATRHVSASRRARKAAAERARDYESGFRDGRAGDPRPADAGAEWLAGWRDGKAHRVRVLAQHDTPQSRRRNVTARGILAELAEQRRLAVAEVQRVLGELRVARECLAEVDGCIAAVRAA